MTKPQLMKLYVLAFVIGFLALTLEVLGIQIAFFYYSQPPQALGLSLFAFLLGLATSSLWAYSLRKSLDRHFYGACGFFLALSGISAFGLYGKIETINLRLIEVIKDSNSPNPESFTVPFTILCFFYLFLPAVIIGVVWPMLSERFQKEDSGSSPAKTVSVYFVGAAFGSLLTGFYLIPHFGLHRTTLIAGSSLLAVAILILGKRKAVLFPVLSLAVLLYLIPIRHLETSRLFAQIYFQDLSPEGLVTISASTPGSKDLFVNQRQMCGTFNHDADQVIARLPFQIASLGQADVLNIGLGCGFTSQALAENPRVDYLDIVESNPIVAKASAAYFRDLNGRVLENPKVYLNLDNGFDFLNENEDAYDLIVVNIEEPTIMQTSHLYTKEFFELAAENLTDNGVLALWSIYQPDTARVIANTLSISFRNVLIVPTEDRKILFFASNGRLADVEPRYHSEFLKDVQELDNNEIATIENNPYAKYFNIPQTQDSIAR